MRDGMLSLQILGPNIYRRQLCNHDKMFCVSRPGCFWVPLLSAVFLHHPPELLHTQAPVLVLVELGEHRLDLLSRQLLGYLQGKLDFYSGNKPYYKDFYFAGQFLAAWFQTL